MATTRSRNIRVQRLELLQQHVGGDIQADGPAATPRLVVTGTRVTVTTTWDTTDNVWRITLTRPDRNTGLTTVYHDANAAINHIRNAAR